MSTTPEPQLDELARLMREFSTERGWMQFHDPKSLILALVGEVGEAARAKQAAARERFPAEGFRGVAPEKA